MEEFLNNLYNYEYFGFYLIISIIVLVILFLIILFFGKKDQKEREIEATKKLQQINSEAFKEEDNEEKLEINSVNQEKIENDTIILPSIEDLPSINSEEVSDEIPEPVLPTQELKEEIATPMQEVKPEVIESTLEEGAPLLERIEEKPFAFDNTDIFNVDSNNALEPQVKEEIKPIVEEVEVPEFNFDEIVKEVEEVKKVEPITNKGPQIFSSVYVPEQKSEIDLPKIEAHEEKKDSSLDFDLPTLKKDESEIKEEIIEMPVLNDYNLDDLSGETYTINK